MSEPGAARAPIPALDGVRGLAILAVLGHQLLIDGYPAQRAIVGALAPLQLGWIGVQLFFVLSGFLITGILLDTRRAPNYWSSFLARRVLRIFPVYYVLLVLTFVIAPRVFALAPATVAEHRGQLWYWAYLANWAPLGHGEVRTLGHCWSLSVEEQFYLLWPLAVRLLDERALARLCVGVAVVAVLLRAALVVGGAQPELAYSLTPARADALTLGALVALVVRRRDWLARVEPHLARAAQLSLGLLAATVPLGGLLGRTHPITQLVGYPLLAVASALLILRIALEHQRGGGRLSAWLSTPLLRRYGLHSYAIYVFHLPLHLLVMRNLLAPRLAGLSQLGFLGVQLAYEAVGILALLVVGITSYRLIERPFLDLKRFFSARA